LLFNKFIGLPINVNLINDRTVLARNLSRKRLSQGVPKSHCPISKRLYRSGAETLNLQRHVFEHQTEIRLCL
jgi:hypothetical protein